MKRILVPLLTALLFLLFAGTATANLVVDFGIDTTSGSNSGSIFYNGTKLFGNNIEIDNVSLQPGSPGPSIDLTNGRLYFETGNLSSYTNNGAMNWQFNTGGNITITADVIGPGGGTVNTILLKGTWNNPVQVLGYQTIDGFMLAVTVGSFVDEKNEWVLRELGLIEDGDDSLDCFAGPFDGVLNLSFNAMLLDSPPDDKYFQSTYILSGDVNNQVPIPGAVWLLSSGILCFMGVRRKLK